MQHHINNFVIQSLIPSLFTADLSASELVKIKDHVSFFSYGSSVYGNKRPSDYDFIIVSDFKKEQFNDVFCVKGQTVEIQLTFYTNDEFIEMLKSNEISAIECLFLFNESLSRDIHNLDNEELKDNALAFNLTHELFSNNVVYNYLRPDLLRSSLSKKSSNSYVKAKKKIILEKDFDLKTSLKSLWHSFRMVSFGLDILNSRYNDCHFSICNDLYHEMCEDYLDYHSFGSPDEFWDFIHDKYKPRHNALMSVFRDYAKKDGSFNDKRLSEDELYNIANRGYLVDPMDLFTEKKSFNQNNLTDDKNLGIKNGQLPF